MISHHPEAQAKLDEAVREYFRAVQDRGLARSTDVVTGWVVGIATLDSAGDDEGKAWEVSPGMSIYAAAGLSSALAYDLSVE